ncbi:MAG: hypothetical protein P1U56_12285 [Saprospiraceae bacterium]|nr:hypothetical protein [Saprospiraceae bacterium]
MKWIQYISIFVLFLSISFLGYWPDQSDFTLILLGAGGAFTGYGLLVYYKISSLKVILWLGIALRIVLFFAFPNLSDDIYRFVWDGQLTSMGLNPYGYLPSELMDQNLNGFSRDLFSNMNSPNYYTIYPPITQLIFYMSTWGGYDIFYNSLFIKGVFLIAEIFTFFGILKLLHAIQKEESLVLLYFLNPLILIEGLGNLHFEIIMISFLVWGIYFVFVKKFWVYGALLFSLSIATKLLPLMFLPFFLFGLKGNKRLRFFGFGLLFTSCLFVPIFFGINLQNFWASIDLYFQKFEFNGGVYYVLRYIGKLFSGYNLIQYIGPLLGLLTVGLILQKAYKQKVYELVNFLQFAFFSFVVYLMLATTIHPWYLSVPILFSVFLPWRFVLIWSFLILLTYINYSYDPYFENLWIVGIEYLIVIGYFVFELKRTKKSKPKIFGFI